MSQAELARKLNKTRSLLSFIEKTGKVNDLTYFEIMHILGISTEAEGQIGKTRLQILNDSKGDYVPRISELDHLRKENSTLKEMIEVQKSLINMLQKQNR